MYASNIKIEFRNFVQNLNSTTAKVPDPLSITTVRTDMLKNIDYLVVCWVFLSSTGLKIKIKDLENFGSQFI